MGQGKLTRSAPPAGDLRARSGSGSAAPAEQPPDIEDYALIGDCGTAALVSRAGSIDWLCWPRFDSPAVFAALLGTPANGRWRIAPDAQGARVSRHYRPGTLILETLFDTDQGSAALIDCMVPGRRSVVRIVEGRSGNLAMRLDVALRFDYGSAIPWVTRLEHGHGICAVAGPDQVVLHSDVPLHGRDLTHAATFDVAAGQRVRFVLTHGLSYQPRPHPPDAEAALAGTETFWTAWSARCTYHGIWRAQVLRSLITLKALSYAPTGGIVAAPTTSLPEQPGGQRNWDYRFCWLRDATFTLMALMHAGYQEEARAWGDWLRRSVAGTPAQVQTLYGLAGERWIMEWEVPWLRGYQGASPVRVGNAASTQVQLDVYGELLDALYQEAHGGLVRPQASWDLQTALIGHLAEIWQQPDEGIWEVRGGARHFTFSKAMAWVAMDRAIRTAEEFGLEAPLETWRALRARIHDAVCRDGFNTAKGAFVQYYGADELDASLLLLPLVGFLPADDPRMRGTIEAIGRDLMTDGLVQRYRTHQGVDGLPPGEGVFLACSFWYADCLTLLGRRREARTLFEKLLALCNDVGLLAEEYDPVARRLLGNFPQAFSHLALINTALNLENAHGPAHRRGRPGPGIHDPGGAAGQAPEGRLRPKA
ncbi:MAG TPA: glycoside hydrolase family 15 protein [Acetobacteraceae bacterium]|nr:glycoside hydrolase family 15 protein [Acetobacteraceae bacterium]